MYNTITGKYFTHYDFFIRLFERLFEQIAQCFAENPSVLPKLIAQFQ